LPGLLLHAADCDMTPPFRSLICSLGRPESLKN
jgi:hypothetical protein